MNNRTLAKTKSRNSTIFLPVFDKKLSDQTATSEQENEIRDVSNLNLGHNFGDVQVESRTFKQSCPLVLSGPSYRPFGGACHTCTPRIQTKLSFNKPGDKYEEEADSMAERVMRMPEPSVRAWNSRVSTDRLVQRGVAADHGVTQEVPSVVHAALSSPGKPIDANTRAYFEPRFGHDFSSVRVHTDSGAQASAARVGALAYTLKNDIVFAAGKYAIATTSGRRLLAHELSHVIQQSRDTISEVVQRKPDKGRVVVKVVETGGAAVKSALVALAPNTPVIGPGWTPVNADGLVTFEVEEGDYSIHVDPRSECFARRNIPYFSVTGNTTQGTVIRLKNNCVA